MENYEERWENLKKNIPKYEKLVENLSASENAKTRAAQLEKMRIVLDLVKGREERLSNTQLAQCEKIFVRFGLMEAPTTPTKENIIQPAKASVSTATVPQVISNTIHSIPTISHNPVSTSRGSVFGDVDQDYRVNDNSFITHSSNYPIPTNDFKDLDYRIPSHFNINYNMTGGLDQDYRHMMGMDLHRQASIDLEKSRSSSRKIRDPRLEDNRLFTRREPKPPSGESESQLNISKNTKTVNPNLIHIPINKNIFNKSNPANITIKATSPNIINKNNLVQESIKMPLLSNDILSKPPLSHTELQNLLQETNVSNTITKSPNMANCSNPLSAKTFEATERIAHKYNPHPRRDSISVQVKPRASNDPRKYPSLSESKPTTYGEYKKARAREIKTAPPLPDVSTKTSASNNTPYNSALSTNKSLAKELSNAAEKKVIDSENSKFKATRIEDAKPIDSIPKLISEQRLSLNIYKIPKKNTDNVEAGSSSKSTRSDASNKLDNAKAESSITWNKIANGGKITDKNKKDKDLIKISTDISKKLITKTSRISSKTATNSNKDISVVEKTAKPDSINNNPKTKMKSSTISSEEEEILSNKSIVKKNNSLEIEDAVAVEEVPVNKKSFKAIKITLKERSGKFDDTSKTVEEKEGNEKTAIVENVMETTNLPIEEMEQSKTLNRATDIIDSEDLADYSGSNIVLSIDSSPEGKVTCNKERNTRREVNIVENHTSEEEVSEISIKKDDSEIGDEPKLLRNRKIQTRSNQILQSDTSSENNLICSPDKTEINSRKTCGSKNTNKGKKLPSKEFVMESSDDSNKLDESDTINDTADTSNTVVANETFDALKVANDLPSTSKTNDNETETKEIEDNSEKQDDTEAQKKGVENAIGAFSSGNPSSIAHVMTLLQKQLDASQFEKIKQILGENAIKNESSQEQNEAEPETPSKPIRKNKNELDRLIEDINSMFIRDGVMQANGKRRRGPDISASFPELKRKIENTPDGMGIPKKVKLTKTQTKTAKKKLLKNAHKKDCSVPEDVPNAEEDENDETLNSSVSDDLTVKKPTPPKKTNRGRKKRKGPQKKAKYVLTAVRKNAKKKTEAVLDDSLTSHQSSDKNNLSLECGAEDNSTKKRERCEDQDKDGDEAKAFGKRIRVASSPQTHNCPEISDISAFCETKSTGESTPSCTSQSADDLILTTPEKEKSESIAEKLSRRFESEEKKLINKFSQAAASDRRSTLRRRCAKTPDYVGETIVLEDEWEDIEPNVDKKKPNKISNTVQKIISSLFLPDKKAKSKLSVEVKEEKLSDDELNKDIKIKTELPDESIDVSKGALKKLSNIKKEMDAVEAEPPRPVLKLRRLSGDKLSKVADFIIPAELKLRPWLDTEHGLQKELPYAEIMLRKEKLQLKFKCMGSICDYATGDLVSILNHYGAHAKSVIVDDSWLLCPYCQFKSDSKEDLISHINVMHGFSAYQCLYCFYRSCSEANIVNHQIIYHSTQPRRFLVCVATPIDHTKVLNEVEEKRKLNLRPFICTVCTLPFFVCDFFVEHIKSQHLGTHQQCHLCNVFFTKSELVEHYASHNIGIYECIYCVYGTNNKKNIENHMCVNHPFKIPHLVLRLFKQSEDDLSEPNKNDVASTIVSLITKEANESMREISAELQKSLDTRDKVETPPQKTFVVLSKTKILQKSSDTVILNAKVPVIQTTQTAMAGPSTQSYAVMPRSNVGGFNPSISPSPSSVILSNINSLQTNRVSPLKLTITAPSLNNYTQVITPQFNAANGVNHVVSIPKKPSKEWTEEEKKEIYNIATEMVSQTGIKTNELYRCGVVNCKKLFPDKENLEIHMANTACGKRKNFQCIHCKSNGFSAVTLLAHLKTHGPQRYFCYFCCSKFAVLSEVKKHIADIHKTAYVYTFAMNPVNVNQDTDIFVTAPSSSKEINPYSFYKNLNDLYKHQQRIKMYKEKTVYSPDEINILPSQNILNTPLQCSVCDYNTKVRLNFVRHLNLHSSQNPVPRHDPVNPVPCLESKEKHFDKMYNLASSSHSEGTVIFNKDVPQSVKYPIFVSYLKRFTCSKCTYINTNEEMMKSHLDIIHMDAKNYICPHCSLEVKSDKRCNDKFIKHLRFHGNKLFRCRKCDYFHYDETQVNKHISVEHLCTPASLIEIVRDMNENSTVDHSSPSAIFEYKWKCNFCTYRTINRSDILKHIKDMHEYKNQFICTKCSFNSIREATAVAHLLKHCDTTAKIEKTFSEVDDNTPLWRRNMTKTRNIRGIPLDEDGDLSNNSNETLSALSEYNDDYDDTPTPLEIEHVAVVPSSDVIILPSRQSREVEENTVTQQKNTVTPKTVAKKAQNDNYVFVCYYCSESFHKLDSLKTHWGSYHRELEMLDTDEKPFLFKINKMCKCFYCSKIGSTIVLGVHISKSHKDQKIANAFTDINNTNQCAFCSFKTLPHKRQQLLSHFETEHMFLRPEKNSFLTDEFLENVKKMNLSSYKCMRCPFKCNIMDDMEHHYMRHHTKQTEVEYEESVNDITIFYQCHCKVLYGSEEALANHLGKDHNVNLNTELPFAEKFKLNNISIIFSNGFIMNIAEMVNNEYCCLLDNLKMIQSQVSKTSGEHTLNRQTQQQRAINLNNIFTRIQYQNKNIRVSVRELRNIVNYDCRLHLKRCDQDVEMINLK